MMDRQANKEMIQGYMDGRNLDNPWPKDNRSYSYRHGFKAGRNDVLPEEDKPFGGLNAETIRALADAAMEMDDACSL